MLTAGKHNKEYPPTKSATRSALFADENGSWIRAAVVLATQFASFALFVRTLHSLLAGIFLATAAVTMIALDRNAVPETLPMLSDVAFGNDGAKCLVLGLLRRQR